MIAAGRWQRHARFQPLLPNDVTAGARAARLEPPGIAGRVWDWSSELTGLFPGNSASLENPVEDSYALSAEVPLRPIIGTDVHPARNRMTEPRPALPSGPAELQSPMMQDQTGLPGVKRTFRGLRVTTACGRDRRLARKLLSEIPRPLAETVSVGKTWAASDPERDARLDPSDVQCESAMGCS